MRGVTATPPHQGTPPKAPGISWPLALGIAILATVVGVGGVFLALDVRAPLTYYYVLDDTHIVVGAGTEPSLWSRVTSVVESPTSVTVVVRSVRAPVASTGGDPTEWTVSLASPLAGRSVIDGGSGLAVQAR